MPDGSVPWNGHEGGLQVEGERGLKRDFDALTKDTFDLIIIGGGIIGAGIARDAAMRGLRTLLLEKEDFAYGTTSRSTRLIHGGLRYLRQLEFHLVRQDLKEREVLLKIAPHLVHPLPFIIPITRRLQRSYLALGMRLYDLLSFDKTLPSHQRLSRCETLELEPSLKLEGLIGSYLYYDCQVPFAERLCLENILSAVQHRACTLNHAKVTGLLRANSAVCGVQVRDLITREVHQVRSRIIINATGHWVDTVQEMLQDPQKPMVRRTKGIHLLIPKVSNNAIVLFARTDGRLFFTIPWQGYSLVGTTDTDYYGDLDNIHAEATDVAYLMTEVRRAFPFVREDNVFYTTAGLRPLVECEGKKASEISRAHSLVDHEEKDRVSGFITVLGGKITGYRAIAQEAVDLVCQKLGLAASCRTAETPLPGAPAVSQEVVEKAVQENGLPAETVTYLAALYGSRFSQVLDLACANSQGFQPLCPHCRDILAQIWHAVENEGALTVSDFLLRRSAAGLNSCQGLDAVETVAQEMGRILGWNSARKTQEVEAYRSLAALGLRSEKRQPLSSKN